MECNIHEMDDGYDGAYGYGGQHGNGNGNGGVVLTRLQLQILAECASGGSMTSAAKKLHYSYGIISHQIQRARRALGATSNPQACLIAHNRGWISGPTGSDLRSVPLIH